MTEGLTPSQTVGPFFAIGLRWDEGPFAVADGTPGAVVVHGRVLDGAGDPVPDAVIETWQTDPAPTGNFRAFTRCGTDDDGRYAIRTLKPGRPPYLEVSVFARGLLDRVVTRIYFEESDDPVLAAAGDRAKTLIAEPDADGYRLDIRLQGPDETVFLSI